MPLGPPERRSAAELAGLGVATVVGFGATALAAETGWPAPPRVVEPGPLAGAALRWLAAAPPEWDPGLLVAPLYLAPPAVTPAAAR